MKNLTLELANQACLKKHHLPSPNQANIGQDKLGQKTATTTTNKQADSNHQPQSEPAPCLYLLPEYMTEVNLHV